jgi:hypothetical protein
VAVVLVAKLEQLEALAEQVVLLGEVQQVQVVTALLAAVVEFWL